MSSKESKELMLNFITRVVHEQEYMNALLWDAFDNLAMIQLGGSPFFARHHEPDVVRPHQYGQ